MLLQSGLLKRFTITKNYSDNLPMILGDEMLLEKVVSNLEINAAHAMDSMGELRVAARIADDGSFVEFQIADNGHGIPEDRRRQIFIPFYTTKEKGKGTGLGMYIIKKNIEQHKGFIKLDSKVGIGTAITVGLPKT